jgi:hypothetical protein
MGWCVWGMEPGTVRRLEKRQKVPVVEGERAKETGDMFRDWGCMPWARLPAHGKCTHRCTVPYLQKCVGVHGCLCSALLVFNYVVRAPDDMLAGSLRGLLRVLSGFP